VSDHWQLDRDSIGCRNPQTHSQDRSCSSCTKEERKNKAAAQVTATPPDPLSRFRISRKNHVIEKTFRRTGTRSAQQDPSKLIRSEQIDAVAACVPNSMSEVSSSSHQKLCGYRQQVYYSAGLSSFQLNKAK
jgi:hypothetical protein